MRAYQVTGPDMAALCDLPEPAPGPGEISLRILACGLKFADLLMIRGSYQATPPLPFTPGLEVCGVVTGHGPGGTGPAIGTRVAAFGGHGGLAQAGCFPADRAVPVPETMPSEVAAGFLVAWSTSHVALAHRGRLVAGERLLVLGAAGGVGLTAVALGAHMGAEVVAVAHGADRLAVARAQGAHRLIDADDPDPSGTLGALGGVDVVYDAVGGPAAAAAFRALRPGGRYLVVGFASGEVPTFPANHLLVKNVDLVGVDWGATWTSAPNVMTDSLAALFALQARGAIVPHVGHVLPFAQVEAALELLRGRRATGKVVVTMADDSTTGAS